MLLLLLVVCIPLILFLLQKNVSKPPVVNNTNNSTVTTQMEFIPSFYPGLSWSESKKQELVNSIKNNMIYYSNKNTFGHFGIQGKEWIATKRNLSKVELDNVVSDVIHYYGSKLSKQGWKDSVKTNGFLIQAIEADGPGGGIWGYIKLDNGMVRAIIFQKRWPYFLDDPVSTENCPCDITFSMFISDAEDLTKLLPKSP